MNRKIALILHELTYTGAPRSVLNMALVLRSLGAEVEVWSKEDGAFKAEFEACGVVVNAVDEAFWIELKRFDTAVFNTIFTADMCSVAQKYVRSVLYVREAGNIADIVKNCGRLEEHLYRIKEMICVSEYAKKYIEKYNPDKIYVVHNFVEDVHRIRINYPWDGKVHFMVSGTIEWRKAQDIAIAAFLELPDELKGRAKLHIAGRQPKWAESYWKNLIPDHPGIIYHGEICDERAKIELYQKMNVFVIPSLDESCSLVALEGAMLGRAVIMSENVGAKYMMQSTKYIFETGNRCELTRKMAMLCSRRELILQGIGMRRNFLKTSTAGLYRKEISKVLL